MSRLGGGDGVSGEEREGVRRGAEVIPDLLF